LVVRVGFWPRGERCSFTGSKFCTKVDKSRAETG
jgi:hypothetical protein